MDGFDHILNWKLNVGSHPFPGKDGGTCINEAALVAFGFPYRPMTSKLVLAIIAAMAAFPVRAEVVESQESTTVETREHSAPSAQPKNVIETDEDEDE